MKKNKSMFSVPLVRSLFGVILLKIIGLIILFFLFFSPSMRENVDTDTVSKEIFFFDK